MLVEFIDLVPVDVFSYIWQEWVGDLKDFVRLDIALCNVFWREKYLNITKHVNVALHYDTDEQLKSFISWIRNRNMNIEHISITTDVVQFVMCPFPFANYSTVKTIEINFHSSHHPPVLHKFSLQLPTLLESLPKLESVTINGEYNFYIDFIDSPTDKTQFHHPLMQFHIVDCNLTESSCHKLFDWLVNHCSSLTTLTRTDCSHVEPDAILNAIQQLPHLDLLKFMYNDTDNCITRQTTSFPGIYREECKAASRLTKLEIGNITSNHSLFLKIMQCCPNLQELCIPELDLPDSSSFKKGLKALFTMWSKSLEVAMVSQFCDDSLCSALVTSCRQLKYLELSEYADIHDTSLINIAKNLHCLETLHLESIGGITDVGMKTFSDEAAQTSLASSLTEMSIKECVHLSLHAYKALFTNFQNLMVIEIVLTECDACPVMPFFAWCSTAISHLKQVKEITLIGRSDCREESADLPHRLLLKNTNWSSESLQSLSLTSFVVNETVFQSTLRNCPKLHHMSCSVFVPIMPTVKRSSKERYSQVIFELQGREEILKAQRVDEFLQDQLMKQENNDGL